MEHLRHSGIRGIILEIFLASRFFIFQYGLVYHLSTFKGKNQSVWVDGASWFVILFILLIVKGLGVGRRRKIQHEFPASIQNYKGSCVPHICGNSYNFSCTSSDNNQRPIHLHACLMPTGWGMLLLGIWSSVRTLARGYEIVMGLLLFTPVAFLSWFPLVSGFQTRMLFNQAFSRGLKISRILGGQRKDRSSKNTYSSCNWLMCRYNGLLSKYFTISSNKLETLSLS